MLEIPWNQGVNIASEIDDIFSNCYSFELADHRKFWKHIKVSSYLPAFDRFRRENATFQVGGHQLKDFFPEYWPNTRYPERESIRPSQIPLTEASQTSLTEDMEDEISMDIAGDMCCAVIALVGRRLAVTTEGRLALIPEHAQKGDVVAVVSGRSWRTPYTLSLGSVT